ncbi:hypothetical protein ACIRN4_23545 [Pimelobacter simplex]|uniref:hypothetical protein n=1 Tax=Nocardioides simplex TaxID=2045 RepID=UPI00380AF257
MSARRSVPVLLLATLVAGLLTGLVGVAGVTTPAARAADDGFSVTTSADAIEVGTRPTIEVSGEGSVSGRLRVVVLSTFGGGKGLPKDEREWQTRVAYDGRPVTVEGPVLRVGEYRVKVWFVPAGAADGAVASGAPQAATTFSVQPVASGEASTSAAGHRSGPADAESGDHGGAGWIGWILLTLLVVAGVIVLVLRRFPGRVPGRRRRIDDDPAPDVPQD